MTKLARMNLMEEQFVQEKSRLLGLAYRMVGRWTVAEDLVQDAFLRWRGVDGEVSNPRAYLTSVVTRLCLDHLKSATQRRETYLGTWLPEPVPTPPADRDLMHQESIRFAMLRLLQQLNPKERAAFLLREVLEHDYQEIAEWLEESPSNCRQLVSRAKSHLSTERTRFQAGREQVEKLVEQFLQCVRSGDTDGLRRLLREDVVVWSDSGGKAPAAIHPISGRDKVVRFFLGLARKNKVVQAEVVELNGLPALVTFDGEFKRATIFEGGDGEIDAIFIVSNPDKLSPITDVSGGQQPLSSKP